MRYRVRVHSEAKKDLLLLPGYVRQRISRLVESLMAAPRPYFAQELRDRPDRYRIRVNQWRLIYQVNDRDQVVSVLRVRLKSGPETYQELPEM